MLKNWWYRTVPKTGGNKNRRKTIVGFSLGLIFLSIFSFTQLASAGFNFDGTTNLSNTPFGFSSFPQIATSNSDVYVVWTDDEFGSLDIFFIKSDDDGVSFSPVPDNLSNSFGFSDFSQIAASGDDVYVAWQEDDFPPPPDLPTTEIFFSKSNDQGSIFSGGTPISGDDGLPSFSPKIAAAGNNAYVTWQEDDFSGPIAIFFVPVSNLGTVGTITSLSTGSAFSGFQQIAAVGDDVYVVWQEDDFSAFTTEIFFSKSNDQGSIFSGGPPISGDDGLPSFFPQIAAAGNNVYVTWQEDDFSGPINIFFSASHNNGNTFAVEKVNLSNSFGFADAHQVAAAGDNVYVVWQEDDFSGSIDIFFSASTDRGLTFDDPINLSNSFGFSSFPQVAASGNDVFVVWQDDVSGPNDIFFAASTNNGESFDTVSNFPTDDDSFEPQIAVGSIHIIWQEFIAGNIEVFYNRGVESITTIAFDALQYKLNGTATVTVTDDASNTNSGLAEEILVSVISDTDGLGIVLTLTETDVDAGVFSGPLTFTTDTSIGTELESSPGDIITASFGGIFETANIFPRNISFDMSTYTLSELAKVTANDQNSNENTLAIETITVNITSDTAPMGIELDLIETGPNDGIFESNNLIFMTGNALFSSSDTVKITQEETDFGFTSDDTINTINVEARSTSDPVGILALELTETLPNSGVFEGNLEFTSGPTSGKFLQVADGDIISIEYRGEIANGLIIPNPDSAVGAIEAAIGDIVTASFLGASDASLIEPGGGGGGGGGLLRPSLVLDFTASLLGGGSGPRGGSAPVLNNISFDGATNVNDDGTIEFGGVIIDEILPINNLPTQTVETGVPFEIRLPFTEDNGIGSLEHVSIYFLQGDEETMSDSQTSIVYTSNAPVEFFDSLNFISNVTVNSIARSVFDVDIIFGMIFNFTTDEPVDIIVYSWDRHKRSSYITFNEFLQVVEPGSESQLPTNTSSEDFTGWSHSIESSMIKSTTVFKEEFDISESTFELDSADTTLKNLKIPLWVKNNANWWSQDEISDDDFVGGMKYLIEQNMMIVPQQHRVSVLEPIPETVIPDWVKNNAAWWAEGLVSDQEFVYAIEWLVDEGVMTV